MTTRRKQLALPRHPLGNVTIEEALPNDFCYIDALQRHFVNDTGFVPTTAIRNHLERLSYSLLIINGDPVGYSMSSGGIRKPHRLIQVAIQRDAWRTGLGTALIYLARAKAVRTPRLTMTATVRDRLPMNPTVLSTGAKIVAYDTRPKARNRKLIHYEWDHPDHQQPHDNVTHQPTPRLPGDPGPPLWTP